jgi:hypothetical protein
MYILQLNDMRSSQIEITSPVARAETREELEAFIERERVETYKDGQWSKSFRQGGPLEWRNPPWGFEEHIIDVQTEDDWAARARENYRELKNSIPEIPL